MHQYRPFRRIDNWEQYLERAASRANGTGREVVIEVVDGEDCSGVVVEFGGCSSIEGETPSLLPRRACTERSRLACCSFESLPVKPPQART